MSVMAGIEAAALHLLPFLFSKSSLDLYVHKRQADWFVQKEQAAYQKTDQARLVLRWELYSYLPF